MTDLYINRVLRIEEKIISDDELLQKSGVIIVLAEPGAGKTELLNYLSRKLGAKSTPATIFKHSTRQSNTECLIIDSLDEVARVDESGINGILVKAQEVGATITVLASRSYTWDDSRTKFIRDCFGVQPTVVRLEPFADHEQRQLFEAKFPGEKFDEFRKEVDRFDLLPLLGNPLFLELLAEAFIESEHRFTTKAKIYLDAVKRLAIERTTLSSQRSRPPIDAIVAGASEIFAKLLLSGTIGISVAESLDDQDYPYIQSLGANLSEVLPFVLDTRLFKLSATEGKHEPIHRVVAEYCAAQYLTRRISEPSNTLSLKRCLAVLAPNSTVRNELRGVIGWMAALGDQSAQEAIIDLDPYAVLANGDASQLSPSSQRRLLHALEQLATIDPYFRQSDYWRRFNVRGLFDQELIDDLKRQLGRPDSKSHLRDLLLELLYGSSIRGSLNEEFRAIVLNEDASLTTRILAHNSLIECTDHDHIADFDALVSNASNGSLEIACRMATKKTLTFFGPEKISALLRGLANLYPVGDRRERQIRSRYFIRHFIERFNSDETRYFLDELTSTLTCLCNAKSHYTCRCRYGKSSVSGLLLDRFFEISYGPHDPKRISSWTKPLLFRRNVTAEKSRSVQKLLSDHGLRQAVQQLRFREASSRDELREIRSLLASGRTHGGLVPHVADWLAMLDYAHQTQDVELWQFFFPNHDIYGSRKEPDALRRHARAQARTGDAFLRCWSQCNRDRRRSAKQDRTRFRRSEKRQTAIEQRNRDARLKDLRDNRAEIESGRNWRWLEDLANCYLYNTDGFDEIGVTPSVAENALRNCFPFLGDKVPTLTDLSEGIGERISTVLHAACLAIYREKESLAGISIDILKAVKTESGTASGYKEDEATAFEAEIDSNLFQSQEDLIKFSAEYIEPHLHRPNDETTQVSFISYKSIFKDVRGAIALDWLKRHPGMPLSALETLFDIAAEFGDREKLIEIIVENSSVGRPISNDESERRRRFWLLRNFFFVETVSNEIWNEYSSAPDSILRINDRAGRLGGHHSTGWPRLGAKKILCILETFVGVWPKVDLPSMWGTGSPDGETAYRFLREAVFQIAQSPLAERVAILDRIIVDDRLVDFSDDAKSLKAAAIRDISLENFTPPKPGDIRKLLDENKIASVEDMRALLVELLDEIQVRIKGGATDRIEVFYDSGIRVDENTARNRIVEMLQDRLAALNIAVVIEHHMADGNRCDMTASTSVDGNEFLLVVEVKGQWHRNLFTAASTQLADRYIIYPSAAKQGVYLVLWYGAGERVAGRIEPSITSPNELRERIIESMPLELRRSIDTIVLDLSRS